MIPWIFADLDTIIDSYSEPPKDGVSMSIMEMPKNCSDCPMCYDMIECTVAEPIIDFFKEELAKFDFCTERHPRCPLVQAEEE